MLVNFCLFITIAFSALTAGAADKVRLALNWKPEPQFGGFYAAQEAGEFTKRGINVEITPGGAGAPVVQMVAAGRVEFGIVSADEVVISQARGGDVIALFAVYQTNPQAIMVRAERNVSTLRELFQSAGPIALQKGLPYALYLQQKYTESKASLVPYLGGIANFAAEPKYAQQCFSSSEPLAAKRMGINGTKVFLIADEGFNPYTTVLIAKSATIKADPKLARLMVEAVRAGWRKYLDDPSPANAIMHKLNPSMDMRTFADGAAAQSALIEPPGAKAAVLGRMTSQRWSDLSRQLLSLKLIDKEPASGSLFQDL